MFEFVGKRSGIGGEGGAIFVSERNGLFGVAGDGKGSVVVFLVAAVAKVDHVFDGGDPVDSVFENVMRLGLSDAFALRDSTWPITE